MSADLGSRTAPSTKAARQARVAALLAAGPVRSQGELVRLLTSDGFAVTQATLSRDLEELGAVKIRAADGGLTYTVPDADRSRPGEPDNLTRLARTLQELLVSAQATANVVVARTPPAAANMLASALDRAGLADIAGTVAGDDTVLIVCRAPATDQASTLVDLLTRLAEGRDS